MATKSNHLIKFCRGLFNTSNITGLDIQGVDVEEVETDFLKGSYGIKVTFSVSNHFIGKTSKEVQDDLDELKKMAYLKTGEPSDMGTY